MRYKGILLVITLLLASLTASARSNIYANESFEGDFWDGAYLSHYELNEPLPDCKASKYILSRIHIRDLGITQGQIRVFDDDGKEVCSDQYRLQIVGNILPNGDIGSVKLISYETYIDANIYGSLMGVQFTFSNPESSIVSMELMYASTRIVEFKIYNYDKYSSPMLPNDKLLRSFTGTGERSFPDAYDQYFIDVFNNTEPSLDIPINDFDGTYELHTIQHDFHGCSVVILALKFSINGNNIEGTITNASDILYRELDSCRTKFDSNFYGYIVAPNEYKIQGNITSNHGLKLFEDLKIIPNSSAIGNIIKDDVGIFTIMPFHDALHPSACDAYIGDCSEEQICATFESDIDMPKGYDQIASAKGYHCSKGIPQSKKCSNNVTSCTNFELCSLATNKIEGVYRWTESNSNLKFVRYVRSAGINCGQAIIDAEQLDREDLIFFIETVKEYRHHPVYLISNGALKYDMETNSLANLEILRVQPWNDLSAKSLSETMVDLTKQDPLFASYLYIKRYNSIPWEFSISDVY